MAKRRWMTRWYSPSRLASIAVRVAVSTVFGAFADRREAIAAARSLDPVAIDPAWDYSAASKSDFWFDFLADTGDGWNSTYAMARLLAQPELKPAGAATPLPRGRLLVLGGDQVYPTPSEEDYRSRFSAPFQLAYENNRWPPEAPPDLYALPGNHDWYDGLTAFLQLFCWRQLKTPWSEARPGTLIGGRRAQQTRSYFAIALPHDWWLWGVDIQLTNYIDQEQINFFDHVARNWMKEGSQLILVTGQPDWGYVNTRDPRSTFNHFSYVESLVTLAKRNHRVRLVLTGDSHHYSRYTEGERSYITAGGGGAFLHPTHHLEDKSFAWRWPAPGQAPQPLPPATPGKEEAPQYTRTFTLAKDAKTGEPVTFPSFRQSRALAWRNLGFALLNPEFAVVVGIVCGVFAWLLDTNARFLGSSLPETIRQAGTYSGALWAYLWLVFISPWPSLLVLGAIGGYYYFADFKPNWKRLIAGGLHAAAQTLGIVALTIALAFYAPGADSSLWLIIYVAVCGGILSATIMGLYLLISLKFFKVHWNEAFSALRIKNYKCFLRLRISPDGALTVWPVGLKKVPWDCGTKQRNPPLRASLIEPALTFLRNAALGLKKTLPR